jgi:NAD(P)-dependent dehydrogenase (short-subunit alcohol dehydrogenase family)
MREDDGRVAVVPGGAGSIGGATVEDPVAAGFQVVRLGRSLPSAPVADVLYVTTDVSVATEVDQAVDQRLGHFGRMGHQTVQQTRWLFSGTTRGGG